MSSSDEFFDVDVEAEESPQPTQNPQKPPRPPPPNMKKSILRPSTLPLDFRSGTAGSVFGTMRSLNEDLLTPNSTIDSITAEYQKEMIIRQNRHRSQKLSNGDSSESISADFLSASKTSSLERERDSVADIEAAKRCSLEYSEDSRVKSRYFSCSELLNDLEVKNPGLKRDDSIRSSIKSNRSSQTLQKLAHRHHQVASETHIPTEVPSAESKSDRETCRTPSITDHVIMAAAADQSHKSSASSLSSDISSIASSASAMARRAKSLKIMISKKLFKPKKSVNLSEESAKSDNQSDSSSTKSQQFKVKFSKRLQRLKNEEKPLVGVSPMQEISPSPKNEQILVLKFNADGKLLASGGKDCHVYVWVLREFRTQFGSKRNSNQNEPPFAVNVGEKRNEIFDSSPLRIFYGHTSDVLDLAWSQKNDENWLISCSMDKSVRLWHISKEDCILAFEHDNIVKCCAFHPEDNCYFVSGCLDGELRFWNIPERKKIYSTSVSPRWKHGEMVTCLVFATNADRIVVGTYDGRCVWFETDKLEFYTELVVSEKAITGIDIHEDKLLITSADSRIRLYSMENNYLSCRFKGFSNGATLVIKAQFSSDGELVIAGSEDKHIYCWKTVLKSQKHGNGRNSHWQAIKYHSSVVTSVVFSPSPSSISSTSKKAFVAADENGKMILYF